MANAVEKIFDMTLFNSLLYFPEHATNPDKFWEAISEIEAELNVKIDVIEMGKNPSRIQIKVAKRFISDFKVSIKSNPFDWDKLERITKGEDCIDKYVRESIEFHYRIKKIFKYYVKCMVAAQTNEKVLYVLA